MKRLIQFVSLMMLSLLGCSSTVGGMDTLPLKMYQEGVFSIPSYQMQEMKKGFIQEKENGGLITIPVHDDGSSYSSILYNFKTPGNRISGKSFRCQGHFVITNDGKLRASIVTSSNRAQGFTGAIELKFYDKNERHVFSIYTPSYGVNGYGSRKDTWEYQFSAWETELLRKSSYAGGNGIHTPKGLNWGDIYYYSKTIFEAFAKGG